MNTAYQYSHRILVKSYRYTVLGVVINALRVVRLVQTSIAKYAVAHINAVCICMCQSDDEKLKRIARPTPHL